MAMTLSLATCSCCGLAQLVRSDPPPGLRAACARCRTRLHRPVRSSLSRTASLALAALILFPLGVTLPLLEIHQLGHHTRTSIVEGVATLLAGGQWLVCAIVLLCSIIFPLAKLLALLALTVAPLRARLADHHAALTFRLIEWTGRWGMLDVLLVAVLVAALKLGNVMDVTPGPAAAAFALCVVLGLLAAASFNPRGLWREVHR